MSLGVSTRSARILARIFVAVSKPIGPSLKLTRRPGARVNSTIGLARIAARCIAPPAYLDTQVGANRAKPFGRSNGWAANEYRD